MTLTQLRPKAARTRIATPSLAGQVIGAALLVLACWAALLALAAPVSTDVPVLRSTSPGVGATARPANVQLTFDRAVPAGLTTVRITDPYNRPVDASTPVHPDGRADTVSVPVPRQKYAGTYHVAWSVPTNQSGSVSGTFAFDLASRSPVPPAPHLDAEPGTATTVSHAVAQFGGLAALALLVGSAGFVAFVRPEGVDITAVRRIVGLSWAGLAVATLATGLTYGPYAARAPLSEVLDPGILTGTLESEVGVTLLARLAVLAVAGVALLQLMTSEPARTARQRWLRGCCVLGCGAALSATWGFSGYGVLGPVPALSVAADITHATMLAALAGGAVTFLVALGRNGARDFSTVLSRFSWTALAFSVVFVLTGAYLIWQQVGGFTALPDRVWIAEVALAVVLAGGWPVGLWLARSRPAETEIGDTAKGSRSKRAVPGPLSRFRWLLFAQVTVVLAIVAGTTVLTVGEPSRVAQAEPSAARQQAPPARLEFDTGGANGQGSLDLVVVPKQGEHRLHVTVFDPRGAIKDDVTVTAVFTPSARPGPPVPVSLLRAGAGYLAGSARLPDRGLWELALTVTSADGKQHTAYGVVDVT